MIREILLAGVGGSLGAAGRYQIGKLLLHRFPGTVFPWGTFTVNLLGCLCIGLLAGLDERVGIFSPGTRVLIVTGILGGFTTFSSFGLEVITLFRKEAVVPAVLYILGSVMLGVLLVWIGFRIGSIGSSKPL